MAQKLRAIDAGDRRHRARPECPAPSDAGRTRHRVGAALRPAAALSLAQAGQLRRHRRQRRRVADQGRRREGDLQRHRRRRDQPHLVHDRRRFDAPQGTGAPRLLGRQCQAKHRDADRRLLRPQPRRLRHLREPVPGLLARPVAQLLLRDAIPERRAAHRHQRRHARRRCVLLEHRLSRSRFAFPRTRSTSTPSTGRRHAERGAESSRPEEPRRRNQLCLLRNARPRTPDGRHARRDPDGGRTGWARATR